jgi:hypothetical protein
MGNSLFFRIFGAIALGQAIQENHSDSFIGWVARVDSKVQI